MLDDLVQKRKKIEELKTKKTQLEERLKLLQEQKNQCELKCKEMNIDIKDLLPEIERIKSEFNTKYNEINSILEKI